MSEVTLANLELPRGLRVWVWAHADGASEAQYRDVRALDPDGRPQGGFTRARAQRTEAPRGSAAWLVDVERGSLTPCVVLAATEDVRTLRLLTPRGEVLGAQDRVLPVPSPGARPHASGAAVIAARTGLVKTEVDRRRFALRWESLWLRGVHERDGLGGATWVDVALLPHQLAVAREVLGAPTVRHVLADEVGLGKTVEALMIWSALSAHERGLRCVIAAPRSLVTQWCLEVRRRTEHRLRAGAGEDVPPVYVPGAAIDAMDVDNPRAIVVTEHDALPDLAKRSSAIDMLIVDEAHALNSDQRRAVEGIASSARHLLLLTATPREGRRGSGVAREYRKGFAWAVGLVDPKWPPAGASDADDERALERTVDESLKRMGECDLALLDQSAAEPLLERAGVGALAETVIPERAREDARAFLRASTLLERVVRTRRGALGAGITAARRLIRVPMEYRAEEVALLDAIRAMDPTERKAVVRLACSSWDALAAASGGRTAELRERLEVLRDARAGIKPDAKLEALLDLCANLWDENPAAKIVIGCAYAETRDLVSSRLRELLLAGGLRRSSESEIESWQEDAEDAVGPVAVLRHGQDAMLEALRNPSEANRSMLAHLWAFERNREGGAVALVATTDVASTGLNLQFASALILYDLPWTPGVAEQWIGRLDRVGQRAEEVRVFVMSHRALPTERLLDVYERIGLFDERGFHVAPEVERAIADLLQPSESDESTWEESVAKVSLLIDEDAEDPSKGVSLDLSASPAPPDADVRRASGRFLEAMTAAGFTAEVRADGTAQLQWPTSDSDALSLPGAATALRPPETVGRRSTPEDLAAINERVRSILLTDRRLGEGRWLRASSVAFLSPRHPLFAEVEADLLRDPSLALGGFRASAASVGLPPGVYLLTQTRTFPALGGEAIAWRCGAGADAPRDRELVSLWAGVGEALRRMMRVRCAVTLSCDAWQVAPRDGALRPQPADRVEALRRALSSAKPKPVTSFAPNIEPLLFALERAPDSPREETLTATARIAEEVTREVGVRLERLIARRRAAIEAVGEGDSWRGLRDARVRALEDAEAMRATIDALSDHVRWGAIEADTPRVVAAALFEVHP